MVKNFEDTFTLFDRIHEYDRQTDRQIPHDGVPRYMHSIARQKQIVCGKLSSIGAMYVVCGLNPLIATFKPQSNRTLYSNAVIGTLAVDGWTVTFGTARRGVGGLAPSSPPTRCTRCNSPPTNDQCTNFILFDVAL